MIHYSRPLLFVSFFLAACQAVSAQHTEAPASVQVNLAQTREPLRPIWAWFGYDEPNYTYMQYGKKLLSEIAALSPVPVYVRTHNLLTSGNGTPALKWGATNMYTEDTLGNPVYNWHIADSIFDTYIQRGMKPLAEIGFMPEALSTHPQPYRHHWQPGLPYSAIETGWAYPPKDYTKWGELVYQWVKHCVARYGKKEVESWYWEVWNEADGSYWKGTQQAFFRLYDYAADAVKRALPTATIGGANITGGGMKYLDAFLKHCLRDTNYATGQTGAPLDAVLFHAKGSPKVVNGTVVMNLSRQLHNITDNFAVIQRYPQLAGIPVIIGECDPEGCAACGMATNPENAYRNGTLYASYTAAAYARIYELAQTCHINLIGAVTWAFEFENQPWFAGFRDLATNGVDKPVLNVFRMFGLLEGQQAAVQCSSMYPLQTVLDSGIRRQTDIGALAAATGKTAAVLVWNYHDENQAGAGNPVQVTLTGITASRVTLTHYRIDAAHSNAYEAWKQMGSPQQPTAQQVAVLAKTGRLQQLEAPRQLQTAGGTLQINMQLPRQGISLLQLAW